MRTTFALLVLGFFPGHAQERAADTSSQPTINATPATNAAAESAPSPETNAAADQPPSLPGGRQLPPLFQSTPTPGAGGDTDQLDDIRPPHFYLHDLTWVWLALALLLFVALLIIGGFWLLPGRQLTSKSAYELALEKLNRARGLLNDSNPVPYAVTVSEIIRTYLGQRFHAPSTRRTTEEFLRLMQADATAPLAAHQGPLREFLQACDLVKFARYRPTVPELEEVQERAVDFVQATRPVEPLAQNGRA